MNYTACFLLLLSLLNVQNIIAQSKKEWSGIFKSINEEVDNRSEAYTQLKKATESIGHRLTGSDNGHKAEQFVFDALKSYGFEAVKFQPFQAESWSRGSLDFSVGAEGKLSPLKAVALAHTPRAVDVEAEVVDMGNGVEADYQQSPEKAKGKIVLAYLGTLPGSPEGTKNLHRSEKTALAIKYGAKGIILFNSVPGGVLLTGTASVTGKLIDIPAVCIGLEDGLALKDSLSTSGRQFTHISMTNQAGEITARNVIARLEGSADTEDKIVIGGHLDSWDLATGAIDNGIGSFSILDMARTMKKLGLKPKRSIEFVFFMGEEQGLLGSKAYVEEALADGSAETIRYMLNYDMTNDPKSYHASTVESQALFESIGRLVQEVNPLFKNQFKANVGLHSDHQPFMLQGIPTAGGGDGHLERDVLNCYHADCDSFDLVDEDGMKNTVRFSAMLAYGLADAEEIKAKRLKDEEIRKLLEKNNLEEPLRIAGEWRW